MSSSSRKNRLSKRWRISPALPLAAGLLLLLGGCGHASASGTGAVSAPATATTVASATTPGTATTASPGAPSRQAKPYTCAPAARTLCVMADDDGRTFTVRVGAYFTVELRAAHRTFSAPSESGAKALELIGASHSGGAAEAYYRALAPGHAVLRALERPVCTPGRACPDFVLLWEVQVHVVR